MSPLWRAWNALTEFLLMTLALIGLALASVAAACGLVVLLTLPLLPWALIGAALLIFAKWLGVLA